MKSKVLGGEREGSGKGGRENRKEVLKKSKI